MQEISEQCVASWVHEAQRSHPSVIDWHCPFCSRHVSFTATAWRKLDGPNYYSVGHCPGCKRSVQVFTLNVGTGTSSLAGGRLYMFPEGRVRTPSPEVLENVELSAPLKSAYRSAVNVVNAKEWNAAAVLCRRLLEGITKAVLPTELQKLPLAKQLAELPNHKDLAKPLLELADAVRKGGNLGAHFDLEKEPDQYVATLMLELCEDLMQYLFTLPVRIEDLHSKIEALGRGNELPDAAGDA